MAQNKPLALIIEDDPKQATIFAETLQLADFEISIANTGDVATHMLSQLSPVLIILDLHLPRVSGTDILTKIRSDERLTDAKIILATADELLAESLASQADFVLLKPISFNHLRELIVQIRR